MSSHYNKALSQLAKSWGLVSRCRLLSLQLCLHFFLVRPGLA